MTYLVYYDHEGQRHYLVEEEGGKYDFVADRSRAFRYDDREDAENMAWWENAQVEEIAEQESAALPGSC